MKAWKFCVVLLIVVSCKTKENNSLEVTGSVKNFQTLANLYPTAVRDGSITLILQEIPLGDGQPLQLDSVSVSESKNTFKLVGNTETTGMYDIIIDRGGPTIPFVNDKKEVTIDMDFSEKDKFFSVKGSPASKQLHDFIFDYSEHGQQLNRCYTTIDSLKKLNAGDSILIIATNAKNQEQDKLNNFLKTFLTKVDHGTVASFALGRAAQTLPTNEFETQLTRLAQKFPDDQSMQALHTQYDTYKKQSAEMERRRNDGSWIGKKAPDLIMPDVNGKSISLSSFKGKYVLVDFWASWCGPCRMENPNVVNAYNQFKDRNFTIVGVSLDKTKESWLEAIKADGLNWTQISDLAYWKSKAVATYGFEGIPFNVLIDPQGTVIAEGLRGEGLTSKLNEVIK